MKTLHIEGKTGKCSIAIGESISNLASYCKSEKRVIITDATVRKLHGAFLPKWETIEIGEGEKNKTLEAVEGVYGRFLELELDRSSCVVGIGGGIVCDIAGFAASTYLRGMHFGFVPTTLLAQADASAGGKNGVNFRGYKNLIGTINQPEFVLCDFQLLKTLPKAEISSGFAEIIKHAAIGDAALFDYLEKNVEKALSLDQNAMEKIIYDSLRVKAGIVSADETEKGERRKLNFGHTIGHAVESALGLRHGEAVAIGMVAAARLCAARKLILQKDAERLENLLKAYGLPTSAKGKKDAILDAMRKDKKREGGKVHFVLLEKLGKAKVSEIPLEELEGALDG